MGCYCLNPDCQKPVNLDNARFCQSCGSKLRLKDRYVVTQPLGKGGFGKTFLAVDEQSRISCVIKQLLPEHQGNLKVKELFEREATQLAELGTHPQIPTWFDNFEQGLEKAGQQANFSNQKYLYIVLELIEGQNLLKELEQSGNFNEKKIREFLKDILPVLKFIHDKNVIHRHIKPENIMRRNSDGKLVLIDFGGVKEFTQTNMGKTGLTGLHTPGYAPNEQIRGKVYPSSDLYCLGATCIHLLTGIKPDDDEIYNAFEDRLMWREALAKGRITISPHLIQVLDKLLENLVRDRYQSADEVIKEFIPEVRLSQSSLTFTATKINQILTQTIKITNSIPDTLLEGRWEVAPHPNDPPHTPNSHAWISFSPAQFASNQIDCKITVDTSKLQADQAGDRQILLYTNSSPDTYTLTIKVQTAPLPIETGKLLYIYLYLSILFIISFAVAWIRTWLIVALGEAAAQYYGITEGWTLIAVVYWAGAVIGGITGKPEDGSVAWIGSLLRALVGVVTGIMILPAAIFLAGFAAGAGAAAMPVVAVAMAVVAAVVMTVVAAVGGYLVIAYNIILQQKVNKFFSILIVPLLTVGLGISLGLGFTVGFLNPSIILALAGTGLPLATMILYPILRQRKLIAKYQQSQQHLIKP